MSEPTSGPTRCAVLLYCLGLEQASTLLEQIGPDEAGRIARAAQRMQDSDPGEVAAVLNDFLESMVGNRLLPGEGTSFFQAALKQSGTEASEEESSEAPGLCPDMDPEDLCRLLKPEHPQTLAVVLSGIDPARGAKVLDSLPAEQQAEVIRRLANLTSIPNQVLRRIESIIENQVRSRCTQPALKVNGVELAAGVLKHANKKSSTDILEEIAREDGELSESVKRNMFTFEDLVSMDDRGIRNLLKEIDSQILAKALKAADEPVRKKFFKNMSERAATMLEEDLETLPPMLISEVEEAQLNIVDVATGLIQDGKAMVAGGAGGETVV